MKSYSIFLSYFLCTFGFALHFRLRSNNTLSSSGIACRISSISGGGGCVLNIKVPKFSHFYSIDNRTREREDIQKEWDVRAFVSHDTIDAYLV